MSIPVNGQIKPASASVSVMSRRSRSLATWATRHFSSAVCSTGRRVDTTCLQLVLTTSRVYPVSMSRGTVYETGVQGSEY